MNENKAPSESLSGRIAGRLSAALLGVLLAALVPAMLEGASLATASGRLAVFGLALIPFGIIALLVTATSLLLAPQITLWPRPLHALNQRTDAKDWSARLLLAGVTLPLLLVLTAEASLDAVLTDGAGAGARAALFAVLLAALFVPVLSALARPLAARLPRALTPARALAAAGLFSAFALLLFVQLGESSGGSSAWQRLGVLRRTELDVRLVLYALLAALASLGALLWLRRWVKSYGLVAFALGCSALWVANRELSDAAQFAQLEQNTALARLSVRALSRLADADKDGFSASFGGGDCNDQRADVYPGADDIPLNGVDEDCSGADLTLSTARSPLATGSAAASGTALSNTAEHGTAAPSAAAPSTTAPSALGTAGALPADLNVVLITVDTLRWDLGYTGYARPISKNIDQLAQRSTIFEKAYSLASYTGKSLGPMLIGRYPSETHRGWMHFNKYPPEDVMVQERLKAVGVRTLSVQAHWYFDEKAGLGRGFDVLDLSAAPRVPQGEGDRSVNSPALSDAALRLLADPVNTQGRFFLWVHYLDPHAEYVPHEEFTFGTNQRALYDGEIAFTDQHIGRLLSFLETSGLAAKTAIIFSSDHGEAFSEHGMVRHGFEVWDELVRVPLVVHVPGLAPSRVTARRSAIDLVPTILELFGVRDEEKFLRGQSLLADMRAPEQAPSRPIFIDMPAGPYNGERQAFIDNELKLITSNTRTMGVYDLAKDPGETSNLMKDAAVAQGVHERYLEFRRQLEPVKVTPK